jgi:pantoate--beta-alanine ligase
VTGPLVIVVRTREELQRARHDLQEHGRLALVPTMGALHRGHDSLIEVAREEADSVAASIFVNPLQFGPAEDYASYPRDEAADLARLEALGTDLVFVPTVEEMYPGGSSDVTVHPGAMGKRLCGAYRPGHFEGVLTVVAKLFGLFHPQIAVFGQKDYQQAILIRRMVEELEMGPLTVRMAATVRESDGLALSSRNAYLSPDERRQAVGLHQSLQAGRQSFVRGERASGRLLGVVRVRLAEFPMLRLQYVEVVHPETLESVERAESGSVLAMAAFCGRTRLIDNVVLP